MSNADNIHYWRHRLSVAWQHRHRFERKERREYISYHLEQLKKWLGQAEAEPDGTVMVCPAIYLDEDELD